MTKSSNIDDATVKGFGDEWSAFDQTTLSPEEHQALFDEYFGIFPFDRLPPAPEGFDLGCGSGRWAALVAGRVGTLHCIDPSDKALSVARRRLEQFANVRFHEAAADSIPLADGSQDFGYSLGVFHHIPDTERALADCVRKLRPGAPFLLYIYYRMENRPAWFRGLWRVSDLGRRAICRLPFPVRKGISSVIATTVYWPLARFARAAEKRGRWVSHYPLSAYRHNSFYRMRTDALDRFGTRLEKRFSRAETERMMANSGLTDIVFSEKEPFWVACGIKRA